MISTLDKHLAQISGGSGSRPCLSGGSMFAFGSVLLLALRATTQPPLPALSCRRLRQWDLGGQGLGCSHTHPIVWARPPTPVSPQDHNHLAPTSPEDELSQLLI